MTATVTGSGTAARRPAPAGRPAARRRFALPRASTTPGKVRLIRTRLVIGSGPGTAGTLFGRLEADLDAAIRVGQATFADSAAAGSSTFTGLEAGVVVLALIMATGSAWGLSRRLAEYR
jgi:hypothetical protein